jgi:thiol-disulfide isomerase/thioredoxin
MKKILFILLAVAGMWISDASLVGADTNGVAADTNSIAADLGGIVARVNEKLQQGKNTELDLGGSLNEFDALYARHKGEKSEAVVQILLAKGQLYLQVLNDPEKAIGVLKQIKQDYPDVQINGNTDMLIDKLQKMAEGKNTRASLVVGSSFPDFNEKDLTGNPLSVSSLKGKVVLIDFWATWCRPCVAELPNTLKVYEKYHDKGFEIIGVSLDDNQAQLEKFLKKNNITWPQFFDGKGRDNKLALKYGIDAPPTFYLLDQTGKIISMDRFPETLGNLRGPALEPAVVKALAGK